MRGPRSLDAIVVEIASVSDRLDALAAAAEAHHTAPPELVDVMRQIRVPMIKAPVEVGGDHLHLADQFGFFEALSYWNPTAAWTGFNHAGACGIAGASLDDDGLDVLFGGDASPFMAAVAAPTGTYERVDGGVRVTGRWKYASGVPHSEWVLLSCLPGDGAGGPRIAVASTRDVAVTGEWNVMALQGTGSIDVVADGTFVPDHLSFAPGSAPRRGGPMFSLGYMGYVAPENLGFTMGVCQRFMHEIVGYSTKKARGLDGRLADRGAFTYELGRAQLQVDAARAFARSEFVEVDRGLLDGRSPARGIEQHLASVVAYCTESAVQAVTRLFHFAGAGALFNSSVLQRCFRDAVGSSQHLMASNAAFDRKGEALLAGA